jgi:hypothetical protein
MADGTFVLEGPPEFGPLSDQDADMSPDSRERFITCNLPLQPRAALWLCPAGLPTDAHNLGACPCLWTCDADNCDHRGHPGSRCASCSNGCHSIDGSAESTEEH